MIMDDKIRIDGLLDGGKGYPRYTETPAHLKDEMTKHIEWLRAREEEAMTRWNKKHDED